MRKIEDIKSKAKQLLITDTKRCLNLLEELISPQSDKLNEFILIKSSYVQSEKLFHLNLAGNTEINIDLSKNRLAILTFIDNLQIDDIKHNEPFINKQTNYSSRFTASIEGIEFYKNPYSETPRLLVREKYKTNLQHLEKIIRIQIREENPEISVLEFIDKESNHVFEYLAEEELIISRKIVIMRFNGEVSDLINCNPKMLNLNHLEIKIPKLIKISN